MTSITCLIPSRLESTRFPRKALSLVNQLPMVVHCAKNAIKAGLRTYVCTDHELIQESCFKEDINVIMTPHFDTGTDRCSWAANNLRVDKLIILQGDEPLINSDMLLNFSTIVDSLENHNYLVNGVNPISPDGDHDPNIVKAYCDENNNVIRLTRRPNPTRSYLSNPPLSDLKRQLGLYGGLFGSFETFKSLPKSQTEISENIEMLRWLDHGNHLLAAQLQGAPLSVDTQDDLQRVKRLIRDN